MIAPATSNTVAKCIYGISDTLVSNIFAQAGKCRVPSIVFACDTAPQMETEAPSKWVTVFPRPVDLENTQRLKSFPLVSKWWKRSMTCALRSRRALRELSVRIANPTRTA